MSNPKSIQDEILHFTSALIETGLCLDQNYPSVIETNHREGRIHIIGISGVEDISFALRNISYQETYAELRARRCFNLSMPDGGLVQMLYTFQRGHLAKHTLSFLPSPDLLEFQNNPETYIEDVLYAEVISRNIVVTPIRFDYDPGNYVDYHHPKSHLTIGQYKNCRIPVSAPLTPYQFLNFVLRSFYNTAFNTYCEKISPRAAFFDASISDREQSLPHFRSIV